MDGANGSVTVARILVPKATHFEVATIAALYKSETMPDDLRAVQPSMSAPVK